MEAQNAEVADAIRAGSFAAVPTTNPGSLLAKIDDSKLFTGREEVVFCYAYEIQKGDEAVGALWIDGHNVVHAVFLDGLVGKAALLNAILDRHPYSWLYIPEQYRTVARWFVREVRFWPLYMAVTGDKQYQIVLRRN